MTPNVNLISAVLAFVATLFFVIGCIGYSSDDDTVKNVAWISVDNGGTTVYYALRQVFVSGGGGSGSYNDCASFSDACEKCEDDGKSAFGLMFIAALFAAMTTVACGALGQSAEQLATCYSTSARMGAVSIVLALVALGASLISLSVFMGDCYDEIDDTTNNELEWGPGAVLSIIGLLLMAVVAVLQILFTCIWK